MMPGGQEKNASAAQTPWRCVSMQPHPRILVLRSAVPLLKALVMGYDQRRAVRPATQEDVFQWQSSTGNRVIGRQKALLASKAGVLGEDLPFDSRH